MAAVAAVEVQGTLYHGAAGVPGTAVGKELVGNRNAVGDVPNVLVWGDWAEIRWVGGEETSGVVVGRRLLGSRRVGVVWRLVKSGGLVVQGPRHLSI